MQEISDIVNALDEDNRERDAYSSINGYFYQFELTLLHILNEGTDNDPFDRECTDAEYKLETIEDYARYYTRDGVNYLNVAQIKHYTTRATNSKYYDAILWLYYNYLKFLDKNPQEIKYQAYIFHHDLSDEKGEEAVKIILDEALESNRNKLDAKNINIQDILNKKIDKPQNVTSAYVKILSSSNHSKQNMEGFYQLSKFIKTISFDELTILLEEKLRSRYYNLPHGDTDWLYAYAVSKLIHDGKNKIPFSLKNLDASISHYKPELLVEFFYKERILDKIFMEIKSLEEDVFKGVVTKHRVRGLSDDTQMLYSDTFSMIREFIKEKFQNSLYRLSFLKSVSIKKFIQHFELDSLQEYQVFLENIDIIKSFISKLAKLIYFYKTENIYVDLDSWLIVSEELWVFELPLEVRGSVVIMGNHDGSPVHKIMEILKRFSKLKDKPDVYYLGYMEDINASDVIDYLHDITEINSDQIRFNIFDSTNEHFHIQCLQCLSTYNYDNVSKVKEIFIDGCNERAES